MSEIMHTPPYHLQPDEKAVPLMLYTATALIHGEVVVKELIRVSTWLRTNAAPDRVCLYNARQRSAGGPASTGGQAEPSHFQEIYVATSQVLAYHLAPPAQEPLDYDANEPNRRMQAVIVLLGPFQIEGNLRLASRTSLARYLESAHETFASLYDAHITSPSMPGFSALTTPHLLARLEPAIFAAV